MSRRFARSAPLLHAKKRIFGMVVAFLILNVTRDAAGMNVTNEEWVRNWWYPVVSCFECKVMHCERTKVHPFLQFCVHLQSFFFPYEMVIHELYASVVINDAGYTTNCNFTCAEVWLKCMARTPTKLFGLLLLHKAGQFCFLVKISYF